MSKRLLILAALSALAVGCSDDSYDSSKCGNGIINAGEKCDDGNVVSGDGCPATCDYIEEGYLCLEIGKPCTLINGNGGNENGGNGNENGGNGNENGGNGNENGGGGDKPHEPVCGDGHVEGSEVCDDGNTTSGDGCSADCSTIEEGFSCPTEGYACKPMKCGNGEIDENEECDDGDFNVDYDIMEGSCSTSCKPAHYCGDGLLDIVDKDNGEECDSAGKDTSTEYNGCTLECKRVNFCGDGKKTHDEQCDDGNDKDGDGCSKSCTTEAGFVCVLENGKSNCKPVNCGNGEVNEGETCDDGNRVAGDGCSPTCQLEKGYAIVDGKLKRVCGDGVIQNLLTGKPCANGDTTCEACDDGNLTSGDGCSDQCTIEAGYICPDAGKACVARSCGDGILARGEECDDGNTKPGDGCSERCKIEEGYHCTDPGKKCEKGSCGNGIIDGGETCDEGKSTPSGGCKNCTIVRGWKCETPGKPCTQTVCGDGILEGIEECEEKTAGCVNCEIQTGYHCDQNGKNCVKGRCGDKIVDKGEECDDGNLRAGDGCDPLCRIEGIFECIDDTCRPICGDGLTMWEYGEECDDGNLTSGDGCSSQCKIEKGFTCTDFKVKEPTTISVPITYRDFRGYDRTGDGDGYATQQLATSTNNCFTNRKGHPDFENVSGSTNKVTGLVSTELDAEGKPVWTKKTGGHIKCQDSFAMWYRNTPGMNRTFQEHLTLTQDRIDKKKYVFEVASGFFPLDNNKDAYNDKHQDGNRRDHNFHFTSELSTYFKFNGGETLEFYGDDDVWVYINGKLAVDIGGIHGKERGNVTLSTTKHSGGDQWNEKFGIFAGGIYPIKLFQAERHVTESNYKLTLSGFLNMGAATCSTICGDGIVAGDEQCDFEGDHNNVELQHKYGCSADCKLQPYCGNGILESTEECDTTESWCKNCKIYKADEDKFTCGNGILDPHEQCDGKAGVTGEQVCLKTCRISGCGDGYVDTSIGEECDDGNQSNEDGCTINCKAPFCGDGVVTEALGEVCDDGINDGSYGGCGIGCSYIPPRCGDGVIDTAEGEECDDGDDNNVGGYGKCNKQCKYDARCGDGIVQEEFEQCDFKDNTGCSLNCTPIIN